MIARVYSLFAGIAARSDSSVNVSSIIIIISVISIITTTTSSLLTPSKSSSYPSVQTDRCRAVHVEPEQG